MFLSFNGCINSVILCFDLKSYVSVVLWFQIDEVPDEVYESSSNSALVVNYKEEQCVELESNQEYFGEQQYQEDTPSHSRHSRVSSRHRSRSGDKSRATNRHSSSPHRHA